MLVEVRTDDPDERFVVGAVLTTEPPDRGPLTIAARRWHSGRLLLRFDEAPDRTTAEMLPGTRLVVDVVDSSGHDEEYYDHELVGLTAVDVHGAPLGVVAQVLHNTGHEHLLVRRPPHEEVLVPFVAAIVPCVDLSGGRVVIDPPVGLFDDPEADRAQDPGADRDHLASASASADDAELRSVGAEEH